MPDVPAAFYPPTFTPPAEPLGLIQFLAQCADNPISTIPAIAYREGINCIEPLRGYKVLWVADPELTERILVRDAENYSKTKLERRIFEPVLGDGVLTAEGASWRWQRRILAPLFRHSELLGYVPEMIAAADKQITAWRHRLGETPGGIQPIDADMTDATYDIIVRTMLFGGAPADVRSVMAAGTSYLNASSWEVAFGILGLPRWLPHPGTLKLARAAKAFRRSVGTIIDDRRRRGGEARDMLGRLLAARDPETAAPLSHDQLVDNVATLLEAGHETTAKALTWTLYLLARAPEWQDRLRAEVLEVCGGEPLGPAHVDRLATTERVIKESMRLYPPASVLSRTPKLPVTIAGHRLAAGDQIFMPIYAIHRHEKLWDDPARFDPDRFLAEHEARRPRTAYLPFGAGPRTCIGSSFAMIEAKVLLARFLMKARFEWDGRHEPIPISRVTLRPKGGMPLVVRLRR